MIDFVPRREFVISHPFNHFNKSSALPRTHKTLIAAIAGNQKPSDCRTEVRDYLKVLNWKLTLASSVILFPLELPFSLELATRRKGVEKARNRRKIPDNSNYELKNWFSSGSSSSSSLDSGGELGLEVTLSCWAGGWSWTLFQELLGPAHCSHQRALLRPDPDCALCQPGAPGVDPDQSLQLTDLGCSPHTHWGQEPHSASLSCWLHDSYVWWLCAGCAMIHTESDTARPATARARYLSSVLPPAPGIGGISLPPLPAWPRVPTLCNRDFASIRKLPFDKPSPGKLPQLSQNCSLMDLVWEQTERYNQMIQFVKLCSIIPEGEYYFFARLWLSTSIQQGKALNLIEFDNLLLVSTLTRCKHKQFGHRSGPRRVTWPSLIRQVFMALWMEKIWVFSLHSEHNSQDKILKSTQDGHWDD